MSGFLNLEKTPIPDDILVKAGKERVQPTVRIQTESTGWTFINWVKKCLDYKDILPNLRKTIHGQGHYVNSSPDNSSPTTRPLDNSSPRSLKDLTQPNLT